MKTELEKQNQNTDPERIWLEKGRHLGVVGFVFFPDCKFWLMFRLAVLLPRLAFLPFLGYFLSCKDNERVLLQSPNVCCNYRKEKAAHCTVFLVKRNTCVLCSKMWRLKTA